MSEVLFTQYRRIAERLLGEIDWQESGEGFCRCPGHDLHTSSSGKRDCIVRVSGAPTIYCVHSSCSGIVGEKNRALRSDCGKAKWAAAHGGETATPKPHRLTAAERAKIERQHYLKNRGRKARAALPGILRNFAWPSAAITCDSPTRLGPPDDHWRLLLSIFQPDDVVWIGNKKDSGRLRHRRFFRRAVDWLAEPLAPLGPLVAASTFQPGSFERSKARVENSRILVVESDTLERDQVGAVFRFLRDAERLPLFAVIDTAGQSLHAWMERPTDAQRLEELLVVLPSLGCDSGPLREPCLSRLPGAWRGTRQQHLIFFDDGSQSMPSAR